MRPPSCVKWAESAPLHSAHLVLGRLSTHSARCWAPYHVLGKRGKDKRCASRGLSLAGGWRSKQTTQYCAVKADSRQRVLIRGRVPCILRPRASRKHVPGKRSCQYSGRERGGQGFLQELQAAQCGGTEGRARNWQRRAGPGSREGRRTRREAQTEQRRANRIHAQRPAAQQGAPTSQGSHSVTGKVQVTNQRRS